MKLIEFFHKPIAHPRTGVNQQGVKFDQGDLVVDAEGNPGQVMSEPDEKGEYQVKLKTGKMVTRHGSDLKLGIK